MCDKVYHANSHSFNFLFRIRSYLFSHAMRPSCYQIVALFDEEVSPDDFSSLCAWFAAHGAPMIKADKGAKRAAERQLRRDFLASVPLVRAMTDDARAQLADISAHEWYDPDEVSLSGISTVTDFARLSKPRPSQARPLQICSWSSRLSSRRVILMEIRCFRDESESSTSSSATELGTMPCRQAPASYGYR
eukprot:SAG31_NODE_2637_length_5336_cov_2.105977_3_plen_191_part_00